MRDVNRLEPLYLEMAEVHKKLPDMRIMQLMQCFMGDYYQKHKVDPFYLEDDEMVQEFEKYITELTTGGTRR